MKSRLRLGIVLIIAALLLAIAGAGYYVLLGQWHGTSYAAGRTNTVKVSTIKEDAEQGSGGSEDADEPEMIEAGSVIRGSEVTRYLKSVTIDDVVYRQIKLDESAQDNSSESGDVAAEAVLYMTEDSLADTREETVLERDVYVRTPATIYEEAGKPDIASLAPKGAHLVITGYDELRDNGYINMYKVEFAEEDGKVISDYEYPEQDGGTDEKLREGYVYGKYMTDTQEEADKPYNEHGEYDAAAGDGFRFELYGGKAEDLDFYPYERTEIEGNEFCRYARAMYLNAYAATHPEEYVKLIKSSGCNAVVIDLKDGPLTYKSKVAEELSPTAYKHAYYSAEELKNGIDAYREAGVYLIGRIVTFNDPDYAADHPEDCIKYGGNESWPSAYSRRVWEYNVKLAQEAVREYGLNEIQFDYVRFPEAAYEMSKSGKANFRNTYGESKAQAVQNFVFYAADQLRESGAYISIDVFGESAYSYVTAYGQYWTAISNIADAISAMPYTDHFSGDKPWEDPYGSVKRWAKRAAKQQKRLQEPAAARTWITGYNTPHWAPTVDYNEARMSEQIKALEECGLDGGFIPWNVLSDIGKYKQYKAIWNEK